MKFGIGSANTGPFAGSPRAALLGRAADGRLDRCGRSSTWFIRRGTNGPIPAPDGKMPGGDNPIPDPLVWLAYVATTSELTLATGISLLPERHPSRTPRKSPPSTTCRAVGFNSASASAGCARNSKYSACRGNGERRDRGVHGRHTPCGRTTTPASRRVRVLRRHELEPEASQQHRLITIGGHSRGAAERAGRIGDGFFPAKGDMAELVGIVTTTAAEHGRDPDAIEMTGIHPGIFGEDPAGAVEEAESWGLDRIIVPSFMFFRDPEPAIAAMGDKLAPMMG